ncbi:MAG: trigger factor [Eubacteriales bacterium]|nr:trigger factor [Eubacteriales bacterium]
MKKKAFLAVLAICVALSTGACGGDKKETDTAKTETTAETDTEKESGETETEEETKEEKTEEKKSSGGTRLVSVKDIDKYITIGEYKGLALENTVDLISDEDVEAQVEYEMQSKAEEVTDKNGTVQTGDLVTIDFVGTKDGEAFDGGTANNYDLTIGEGGMIDGFEDGIIGMKKGETKELPLTFPEDYFSEEMAGQDVVFKITLQNFRRVPELTDEWTAKNTDFATVEEYKQNCRKELEDNAKESAKYQMYSNAWNMVLESSEIIEFPEEEIDNCIAEFKRQIEVYAKQADMELSDFVVSQGYTEESFEDECRQYAEYKVKQNLIVQGIMDAEGLSLDDKECLEIQDQLIEIYGVKDLADLIDQYGQVNVDESIGLLRVEQFIADQAEVTEQVADGDQVGVNGDAEDTSVDEGAEDEEIPVEEEVVEDPAEEEAE